MFQWQLDPLGPEAACRGCGRGLWRTAAGRWEDGDGGESCAPGIEHVPMPEGFIGAPERVDLS